MAGDACVQIVRQFVYHGFQGCQGLYVFVLIFFYQSNLVAQAQFPKPQPFFGSHASYHIAIKHHGEEADDGDDGMEDSCYPCNAYVALNG